MEESYILSGELAILLIVWFVPPWLLFVAAELYIFSKVKPIKGKVSAVAISSSILLAFSLVIGYILLPLHIPSWLAASNNMLFLPLAYFIIGGLSIPVIYFVLKYARARA